MKLLFDCSELSYWNEDSGHKAGVFYVSKNLLNEFLKMGIDITFYCDYRRYYFMKDIEEFKSIQLLKECSFINKLIGKLFYLTDKLPKRIKYALLILSRFYDKYLYRVNKSNYEQLKDFDVYFSPFSPPPKEILQSNLKRFRMIHDVIPILENGMPKLPTEWHYKIYNDINSEDYYVTNSNYTKEDVLKYFSFIKPNHIRTTLLGANEKFYPQVQESDEKYVFSLCTLGKRKNLIFAIRNFFKFIENNNINNLKLVLGGAVWTKYARELNEELNKHDCSNVVLTGYIQEDDLRKYYSNALCFIYPSLYEGFGLPVLEAMQCGCPVITSNKSSLPEVIGDCGIQINPEDDKQMQEALYKMYYNDVFRAECKQKGLNRAKIFSWQKCAEEIVDFINNTVK